MTTMAPSLHCAYGQFQLQRWPPSSIPTLRPWDAADELLLSHIHEEEQLTNTSNILLINDNFGALACALNEHKLVTWSDSWMSHHACRENLRRNTLDGSIQFLPSTSTPTNSFDVVLLRIPKSFALLEQQLTQLKTCIHSDTKIIAAAMLKHLSATVFKLMEKILGPANTSLAVKKARLIFARPTAANTTLQSPYPSYYEDKDTGLKLKSHAGVFSQKRLDIGTRFLLSYFDKMPAATSVADLGCGNGVLGLAYLKLHTSAHMAFIDESYLSIQSAQENYMNLFPDREIDASFECTDGLEITNKESLDLILCNPPFHQQHVVDEHLALRMLRQSKRCLRTGGELWIVCNRHLSYRQRLRQLFGHCDTVAENSKFTVLRSTKKS